MRMKESKIKEVEKTELGSRKAGGTSDLQEKVLGN